MSKGKMTMNKNFNYNVVYIALAYAVVGALSPGLEVGRANPYALGVEAARANPYALNARRQYEAEAQQRWDNTWSSIGSGLTWSMTAPVKGL